MVPIRADVGDEKLMTYGRFHAGIRNLCSFLDLINGSLITERVAAVPALQHFSENSQNDPLLRSYQSLLQNPDSLIT